MSAKPQQPVVRTIPSGHAFDPKSLKPLSATLLATSVALGHALSAYRHLSRIKSTTVSPDGYLGGSGYVMSLKDMRKQLYEATEALSSIADSLYDEVSAPHWKATLKKMPSTDQSDILDDIADARDAMGDPDTTLDRKTATLSEIKSRLFLAASEVPGALTDLTRTDAHDWGLGYGADGGGVDDAGYTGTLGPHSALPGSPNVSPNYAQGEALDTKATTRKGAILAALYGTPEDGGIPVARSDYYDEPKDNLVSIGSSDIPEGYSAPQIMHVDISNTFYRQDDLADPRLTEPSSVLLASNGQRVDEPKAHNRG